ncbi:MAG TPA: nuclear transport factor 2 family protein [Vicinamibacterales bacterium]|jgi:ketosteroid isomerase-like protein
MNEAQNTKVVQDAYAAFLKQDLHALLALMDEQIVWKPVTGAGRHVPTAGERRGVGAVAEFFKIVAQVYQFSRFEPQQFIAQGDTVVTLGHYTATTSTGGSMDSDFVMIFTIRGGKIVQFQEFLDSAALNAAFATAPVSA